MQVNSIELLNVLSSYYFKFGILTSDGVKEVEVNIYNTDKTISKKKMKISDIMYFTEYGTITLPGQFILEKSLAYINNILNDELDTIVTKILIGEIKSENEVVNFLNKIKLKIEDHIRNLMQIAISKNNTLGSILNKDRDDNKYIYDLKDLSKYLKCLLIKL